jgi:hypothetical protein
VTIWGEMDGLLMSRDRFVKIDKVIQTPESTLEGYQDTGLVRTTISDVMDGLPLSRDRFVKVA